MSYEARAYLNANQQDLPNQQWEKINMTSTNFNVNSGNGEPYDTDNKKYICKTSGVYLVSVQVRFNGSSIVAFKKYGVGIFVNGVEKTWHVGNSVDNIESCSSVADVVKCNENDYIELKAYSMSGNNEVDASGNGSPANSLGKYTKMAVTKLHD